MMEQMINKPFSGPPETTRDTVIVAGLALHEGNWRRCRELVLGLKVWSLWTTRGWAAVSERYERLIRETGLKTYLVAFAPHYDSMSMKSLCSMFLLGEAQVHSLVSKMMINKELLAAWDQPTSSIVMHKIHISPLQHLALEFADKAGALVESNERLLATRTGQFSRDDMRMDRGSRYLSVRRLRRRGFDPRKGDKGEGYGFFSASAAKRQQGGARRGGPRTRKGGQGQQGAAAGGGAQRSNAWSARR
jgi:translation initiation factor 3 subunit C